MEYTIVTGSSPIRHNKNYLLVTKNFSCMLYCSLSNLFSHKCEQMWNSFTMSVLTFYVNFCMSLLFEALMKNLLSYVTHQPFQFQTWMLMLRCVNIQAKKSLATSEIRLWIWDVFSLILECACYFGILYHSPWGGVRCGLKALNVKFIKLIL